MAETRKTLAQAIPAAAVLTTLYTVPASTSTITSTLLVCNRGAATTFRVSVAIAGAADTAAQYVFYDVALAANETRGFTIGTTHAATDVIRCYSASGNVTFNLFGVEIT